MSEPSGILDAQLRSLTELVDSYRDERCQAILEQARAQRDRYLQQAYREARERMHEAIQEERARARREIRAAEAHLQTRRRQRRHQAALDLLHHGWEQLRDALRERWRDDRARAEWLQALTDQACQRLPASRWQVEHPPGWSPEEAGTLRERAEARCGEDPAFQPDQTISGGLRIRATDALLDGTVEGILTDRRAIEGELLAELHHLLAERGEDD
ncbi:MAG TPA: hypothetical protein VKA64_04385 [Gammaproteobacteria bacterium]|nr:hypothetical protein [Gammaproteobacteria bacterium]